MSCPILGCPKRPGAGMLMCREHWYQVPRALQRDVNRTWRDWNRMPLDASLRSLADAKAAYVGARDAAIAHVNQLVSPCA